VLPQVDRQMGTLIGAPTSARAEALRGAEMAWSARVEAGAQGYRYAMYGTSLLLLAYLAWLFARLRANARALRESEARAEQQQLQLIEANKMGALGMHLEGVAHDMSSPTQAIMDYSSELAKAWPDLHAALDEHAGLAGGLELAGVPWAALRMRYQAIPADLELQSREIKGLIRYLLEYGSPAHSDSPGGFDLNAELHRALRLMKYRIHKHTARFDLQLADGLPRARGDSRRFGQVVVNLVNNALDALTDRQQAVTLHTRLADDGAGLICEVRDAGGGIAPEVMRRLFEPFQTGRADRGGTGLGLVTSRTTVRACGGELWLESEPGRGTRAIVRLPAWTPQQHGGTPP
jgi:polar amino acid transport system substrate-binding protein